MRSCCMIMMPSSSTEWGSSVGSRLCSGSSPCSGRHRLPLGFLVICIAVLDDDDPILIVDIIMIVVVIMAIPGSHLSCIACAAS